MEKVEQRGEQLRFTLVGDCPQSCFSSFLGEVFVLLFDLGLFKCFVLLGFLLLLFGF